jgi:hypothetical protein
MHSRLSLLSGSDYPASASDPHVLTSLRQDSLSIIQNQSAMVSRCEIDRPRVRDLIGQDFAMQKPTTRKPLLGLNIPLESPRTRSKAFEGYP